MRPRLLLATANAGKLRELRELLVDVELVGLRDVGITDLEEPWDDYVANAESKAREASRRAKMVALADDSGLEVDALSGAPGAWSARFSGRHGDEAGNRALLLERLAGVPQALRGARFRCVMALADERGPLGGRVLRVQGVCEGAIGFEERGSGGFGYDPLFVLPEGRTMAELTREEKQARSHRGRAVRAALPWIASYLALRAP